MTNSKYLLKSYFDKIIRTEDYRMWVLLNTSNRALLEKEVVHNLYKHHEKAEGVAEDH